MYSPPGVIRFWKYGDLIIIHQKPYSIYLRWTVRTETLAVLVPAKSDLSKPDNSFCKAGYPSSQRFVDSLHMEGDANDALCLGISNLVGRISRAT